MTEEDYKKKKREIFPSPSWHLRQKSGKERIGIIPSPSNKTEHILGHKISFPKGVVCK
jgi:hypothetical protein